MLKGGNIYERIIKKKTERNYDYNIINNGSYKIENKVMNEIKLNICYIILTILCILEFSISLYFIRNKTIKPEKAFLIIVPLFCILLTLAMPLSKGHDETIHGLRIY